MKHYFKYSNGYINVDDENLYLTNSGNWQETRELIEKGKTSIKKNNARINYMKGFVYTVFAIIIFLLLFMVENNKISITLSAGLIFLAYYVNNYFKGEFGVRYKIPLTKIDNIEPYESDALKISFRNAENEPDFETIYGVEEKGRAFLLGLK